MLEQFYLCRHADGRMVLSDRLEGIGATEMRAEPSEELSAWQVCRARIEDWIYAHRPGYGYFGRVPGC